MAEYKRLIKSCLNNDRRAQNTLYKELFSFLMNICIRYKRNYDDAGAALNTIYLKILYALEDYDLSRPFLPWVKTIAIRQLVDEYRSEKRHDSVSLEHPEAEVSASGLASSVELLQCEDILAMINQLPDTTAKVFNLYVIDGYKHKEIAEMLGITTGTSKWQLNHARKRLKELLQVESQRLENLNMEL
jgi:RNA polymerase sigma-70 factor (ECF subfamily)